MSVRPRLPVSNKPASVPIHVLFWKLVKDSNNYMNDDEGHFSGNIKALSFNIQTRRVYSSVSTVGPGRAQALPIICLHLLKNLLRRGLDNEPVASKSS